MFRHSDYFLHMVLGDVLGALYEVGVLNALEESEKPVNVQRLSHQLRLDLKTLNELMQFVALNCPSIISKQDDKYELGHAMDDELFLNNTFFYLAYRPVFSELSELLKANKVYGVQIQRDGKCLQRSSRIYNKITWDVLTDLIASGGEQSVIDLGAGDGEFLRKLCNANNNIKIAVGIDNDQVVVNDFNEQVGSKKSAGVVIVRYGDMIDPKSWDIDDLLLPLGKDLAITCITALHEHLWLGTEPIERFFANLRSKFKGARLMIAEFNGYTFEDMTGLGHEDRVNSSVYQLVHPLTNQGTPVTERKWKQIFSKCKFSVEEQHAVYPNSTIYCGTL